MNALENTKADTYADISFFLREDLDSAIEISFWPGMSDSTSNLDSKVCAILINNNEDFLL